MGLYGAGHLCIEVETVERSEALRTAEVALHQAGFQVSRRCTARYSCFDFAARREERLIFVKAFPDIREVLSCDASDIQSVSRCFSSVSLFISEMKEGETLRDDTVYSRYGVNIVTSKTLEDIVLRSALPLVKAIPGGYSVRIDGGKIRERRHELGLSIGKLAEMVGVSRRSLYGYERNMARASVSAAYRLEEILGVPLVKTIDIFDAPPTMSTAGSTSPSRCRNIGNRFLRSVLNKLARFELNVSAVPRAPFDFAAVCPYAEFKIVGGVLGKQERHVEERIEEITSLSGIVEAKPLLVGSQEVATHGDVAFLSYDKLNRIADRKELTALL